MRTRQSKARRKARREIQGQLSLFDIPLFGIASEQERIEALCHGDLTGYRTHTIKAGTVVEYEVHPIYNRNGKRNAEAIKKTPEQIKHANLKQTRKKVCRLANQNFGEGDIYATFGYNEDNLPPDIKTIQKDIVNFIRRVKRAVKKQELPELRYLYVIEYGEVRPHVHMLISGDLDRDTLEKMRGKGGYNNTRRVNPYQDGGLSRIGTYLTLGNKGKQAKQIERVWNHSQNLKMPHESIADHKITKKKVEKISKNENILIETFEKLCPSHKVTSVEAKTSAYCAGVYLYVQMTERRTRP